ncbi:helix-turn-helix transcriptional regulator [Lacimicrobium alkaliphilum]|uniref:HTH araC/xylS-type domain-containing protein n=1 Tax=Lacimicrobium alkaliphilum TaxID=1526571 RepID=A0A0U2Z584_9ALTE|nr:helix-turn-helix transcriptional regulator [Lacimicrobium alkaliphilum]ALS98083.1 hypothetical protein AT746_07270 [Lacimicrobium alkaliphilum]
MTQLYTLQLIISLGLLVGQLWVREKQPVHLLFALFCGSMAMCAATRLSAGSSLSDYEFLIAMGGFATCNGYWLVARALHQGSDGLALRHYLVAGSVGVMIILSHGFSWSQQVMPDALGALQGARSAVSEMLNLISSTLLVLSAWEGCRGLRRARGQQLQQQLLFLASFCGAVLTCTVVLKLTVTPQNEAYWHHLLAAICGIQIMLVTQVLILWKAHTAKHGIESEGMADPMVSVPGHENDILLAEEITRRLQQQRQYLQTNLRVSDIAWALDVPEYRISRVMREQLRAQNFNHHVNTLRVYHARELLEDPANRHWPVAVVGMESGFASVGPFTRAFKAEFGQTPNQYRVSHFCESSSSAAELVCSE